MEMDCNLEKLGQRFQIVSSWKNRLKLVILLCVFENSLDIFLLQRKGHFVHERE